MKPSPATDWHSICKVSPGPGETARVAALVDGVKVKDGTTRLASVLALPCCCNLATHSFIMRRRGWNGYIRWTTST